MKKSILLFLISSFTLTMQAQVPNFQLVGFGEATTGGAGGIVVTVTNYADLKKYAESTATYIIYVSGTIENGADGGSIKVKSNKSLIGVGTTGFLFGVGLSMSSVSNIIVQNLKISMTGVTTRVNKSGVYSSTGDEGRPQILTNAGDCIGIQGTSYNIWIDHCEFFSENPSVQTNQDLYDGIIDVKNGSHNITISWNYIHDHHKVHLIGSSDTDSGDRKITFHHNYYFNAKDRMPLYRFGTAHFFNNYLYKCGAAINSRVGACIYVEKNHFENVTNGTVFSKSSSIVGYATLVGNLFTSSTAPTAGSCSSFVPTYNYSAVLNDVEDVKNIVTQWAGVGKLPVTALELPKNSKYNVIQLENSLKINSVELLELAIYSVSGQIINQNVGNSISTINLKNGVYILQIKNNKMIIQTSRFIK